MSAWILKRENGISEGTCWRCALLKECEKRPLQQLIIELNLKGFCASTTFFVFVPLEQLKERRF